MDEVEDLFCCCSCTDRKLDESGVNVDVTVSIEEWDLRRATDGIKMDDNSSSLSDDDEPATKCFSKISKGLKTMLFPNPRNRLALELYGNEKEVLKEQKRQDENFATRWMIHPLSLFRSYWDLFMVFLITLTLIIVPVSITYWRRDCWADPAESNYSYSWVIANILIDSVFIFDVIINFRTGIISLGHSPSHVILSPQEVARHYLQGWSLIDFLSSIPLDEFILLITTHAIAHLPNGSMRLLKLLSLFKLLRVSRLLRYIERWEELLDLTTDGVIKLTKLILMTLILIHWIACVQFLVPSMQGLPNDSWVVVSQIQDLPVSVQYSWSIFKAVSHMMCIGYGRWPPQTVAEAWVTVITMMIGALIYALLIGRLIVLLISVDASGRQYNEKLQNIKQYMNHVKLPQDMKLKVLSYYKHKFHNKPINEDEILSELSHGLQANITAYLYKGFVQAVPFFQNIPDQFISLVIKKLKPLVFMKDEYIIRTGSKGDGMFFVKAGTVEVIVQGKPAAMLSEGSHFGEMSLLTDDIRIADVVAYKTTDLYFLSKEVFNTLLGDFPEVREQFQATALKRLSKNERKSISFLESPASYRPKINTSAVFQSSIVVNNVSSTEEATKGLETIDISGPSSSVKRFISDPLKAAPGDGQSKHFTENGKRKLPPLGSKKFSLP